MRWLGSVVLSILFVGVACSDTPTDVPDAAIVEFGSLPDSHSVDNGAVSLINFVVSDCHSQEDGVCNGVAPMTLTFTAIASGEVSNAVWEFGDGSNPAKGALVMHTYDVPGTYDVTLAVQSTAGTLSERKADFIRVEPAPAGASCRFDESCASHDCICFGSCQFPLDSGICLESCSQGGCAAGAVCVDLRALQSVEPEPWRAELCLPACKTNDDCTRLGFSCQPAPVGSGWQYACLPPMPRPVGGSCRSTSGETDASLCLGGLCLDVGASGYCSLTCKPGSCPDGSRCATLSIPGVSVTEPVCLLVCDGANCQADALLNCQKPPTAPPIGFSIFTLGQDGDAQYCAPRTCTDSSQCGLAHTCYQSFCN